MGKLRNRQKQQYLNPRKYIQIKQTQIKQNKKQKKQKKSTNKQRQSKNKKQINNKFNDSDNSDVEILQDQKNYLNKLQILRKTGNIKAARQENINRVKDAPEPPQVVQFDQFNPNYNGVPMYDRFTKNLQAQVIRPSTIFKGVFNKPPSQTRSVPILFRKQIPSYKSFRINGNIVTRIGQKKDYQQLVLDYILPNTGKQVLTVRIIQSKGNYMWFGVIDVKDKDRQQSHNQKNCITFSFRTGYTTSSNKWSKTKIGQVSKGLAVRMQVNMDTNSISWTVSDGRTIKMPINKLIRRLQLVPYIQMMTQDDEIIFEQ